MKVDLIYPVLAFVLFISLTIVSCRDSSNAKQDFRINTLPMYGRLPKSAKLIEADRQFIEYEDSLFNGDRLKASRHFSNRGWDYFSANVLDTAMFRFNQAWLLDTTNGEPYWGFADILSKKGQYNEALPLFDRAIRLMPDNSRLWRDAALTQEQLFFQTKDTKYLHISIAYSKRAIELDPTNALAYGDLAGAYSYFVQQDSALKYLRLADELDPQVVNPEVRKLLTGK